MKYRVILAFETYSVGQVIEPTGLWADELKRRKYIEPLEKHAALPNQSATRPETASASTAATEEIKPKRGRPRKDDVHRV